ncbi:MAG: lytic transglycosylase domain-containing protein [Myxococcota bacterium]|nr:lytic transglycosylase domain-containing protein [Myxococcota bacterium]
MSGRVRTVWLVAALLVLFGAPDRAAHAEEMYRYVDARGVVHLTNVPSDTRFRKYAIGSAGGTGKGVLILARRESRLHIPGMSQKAALHLGTTQRRGGKPRSPAAYDQLIARIAARHGLPAAMVKAVVKAESNFQPHARSHKGAQGLMQLMPATAEDMGVDDPFEAEDNVQGGSRYLRAMYERFGDWEHALAAYNAGPGAVERFGGIPPYAETRQYVERVLHYYRRYDGELSR